MRLLKETGADICNEYKPGEYSIIIDAIFGVGLSREIIGRYLKVIRQMNEADAVKFAVDIPSGVSADEGSILGVAFQADITVTFQMEKVGLGLYPVSYTHLDVYKRQPDVNAKEKGRRQDEDTDD